MTETKVESEKEAKRPFNAAGRLVLLFVVALAGCNSSPGPVAGPAAGSPEDSGDPLEALVYGPVESALFDTLVDGRHIAPTMYDGSQNPEDFDLAVFDGDAHEPSAVSAHEGVRGAMDGGRWILFHDAQEEHKDALGEHLDFASSGASPGYLVQRGLDEHGREYSYVRELSAESLKPETAGLARALARPAELAAQQVGDSPPQEAIYKKFFFHSDATMNPGPTPRSNTSGQVGSFSSISTLTAYYNDSQTTATPFQWLQSDVEISSTPSNSGKMAASGNYEQAWFQDEVNFSTTPCLTNGCTQLDPRFTTDQSSPATKNNVSSVTSGVSFSVDTSGPTFGVNSSTTRDIEDWAILNTSPNDTATTEWDYHVNQSYNPKNYKPDAPYTCAWSVGCDMINGAGHLITPPDLSTNQLQASLMSVWKTNEVITDTVTVGQFLQVGLAGVQCADHIFTACIANHFSDNAVFGNRQEFIVNPSLKIDFGSVVPIAIASITFEPNPATAGQQVNGTVTLKSPAHMDYDLTLASNSDNATVLKDLTVKEGQSSATFEVLTNGNGLSSGQETVATITATSAFYGYDAQAQLTVKQP